MTGWLKPMKTLSDHDLNSKHFTQSFQTIYQHYVIAANIPESKIVLVQYSHARGFLWLH